MIQLYPCKGPPWMRSQLLGGTKLTCIITLSVLRRGQPDSGESCNVLQNGPTHSLIANFPQRSVIACNTQISCCRGRTLRMRPRTGVYEPDVMAPKAHQNNPTYVSSADLPSDSLCNTLVWWVVTRRTSKKPQNCQNWGVGACVGQYGMMQTTENDEYDGFWQNCSDSALKQCDVNGQ